jgi:ribosomal protein S18 acetylase RimI-like enzyme
MMRRGWIGLSYRRTQFIKSVRRIPDYFRLCATGHLSKGIGDINQFIAARIELQVHENNHGRDSRDTGSTLLFRNRAMDGLASYSAIEVLRNGDRVEIRALRPSDRSALENAVDRTSPLSLYRRFFAVRTVFTEAQASYFVDVDFKKHVALVAVVNEGTAPLIAGGGRYVLVGNDKAEIAFMIIDAYQGRGIGRILLRHLAAIAKDAGIRQFVAEVLPENTPMLRLFEKSGLHINVQSERGVTHVTLDL